MSTTDATDETIDTAEPHHDDEVEDAAYALTELQEASETIATRTEDIAAMSREQAEGMDQVRGEVAGMSAAVEEIASMVDRTASNAEEISDETDGISAAVEEQAAMLTQVNDGFQSLLKEE